jgi:hypothetical protein
MVTIGVGVHLFLRHRVDIDEASGESLKPKAFPAMVSASTSAASSGVVAILGGILLRCFLLDLCFPYGNISPILQRGDDDNISVVSFLRVLLWKSGAFFACGVGFEGVGSLEVWSENKLEA